MKTIKIAHLYYDLMNLYGENGNIKVLAKHLEQQNLNVEIHFLTIDDNINFKNYDFFYIGCGSENNFLIALQDIKKYKKQITEAINNHKFFLATGNALNLFGKNYKQKENKFNCLNILNFESRQIDFRIVGEQIFKHSKLKKSLIGFQNRDSILENINEQYLFEVLTGTGYKPKNNYEGIAKNTFYGTYLLGPILARNPYFTEYIVKNILKEKNLPYQKQENTYEVKAYEEYMKNIMN